MELRLRTEIEEYFYDTEKERVEHINIMECNGWEDSGQKRYNVNQSFYNPEYKLYGKYYRYSGRCEGEFDNE